MASARSLHVSVPSVWRANRILDNINEVYPFAVRNNPVFILIELAEGLLLFNDDQTKFSFKIEHQRLITSDAVTLHLPITATPNCRPAPIVTIKGQTDFDIG